MLGNATEPTRRFHPRLAPEAKFEPLIVSVKEGPPAVALDGEREEIMGAAAVGRVVSPEPVILQPEISQIVIVMARKRRKHRELLPSVRLII